MKVTDINSLEGQDELARAFLLPDPKLYLEYLRELDLSTAFKGEGPYLQLATKDLDNTVITPKLTWEVSEKANDLLKGRGIKYPLLFVVVLRVLRTRREPRYKEVKRYVFPLEQDWGEITFPRVGEYMIWAIICWDEDTEIHKDHRPESDVWSARKHFREYGVLDRSGSGNRLLRIGGRIPGTIDPEAIPGAGMFLFLWWRALPPPYGQLTVAVEETAFLSELPWEVVQYMRLRAKIRGVIS